MRKCPEGFLAVWLLAVRPSVQGARLASRLGRRESSGRCWGSLSVAETPQVQAAQQSPCHVAALLLAVERCCLRLAQDWGSQLQRPGCFL